MTADSVAETLRREEQLGVSAIALPESMANSWLNWQCQMVAGIIRGAIYPPVDTETIAAAVCCWPGEGEGESLMVDIASQSLAERRGIIQANRHYGPGSNRVCDMLACPLQVDGKIVAVVAMMITTRSGSQQHAVLQLLQWGGLWIETLLKQQVVVQRETGLFTMTLMTEMLGQADLQASLMEAANRIADRFECARVSIGLRKGLPINLCAISRLASFDGRSELVRQIEAAMEEAVDQGRTVCIPQAGNDDDLIVQNHQRMQEQQDSGAICSVPLPGNTGYIGAITLERDPGRDFDADAIHWCESLVRLIGPVLEMKQLEERPLWRKLVDGAKVIAGGVFGRRHLRTKIIAAILTGLLIFTSLWETGYRVTAPAGIEGARQQMLIAPMPGYVRDAFARAGDRVQEGQVIAVLDDQDLQLELNRRQGELNKLEKEYQDALAQHKRAELSILKAQMEQVTAELNLVREKIARTEIRAPFSGVLLSGDLHQSLGAPVEAGNVLFEVAPLDRYRVVLEVDERDVAELKDGLPGQLVVSALPGKALELRTAQTQPVAVAENGRNYFRVDAILQDPTPQLRPGMRGVAKLQAGPRKLLWIWTHGLVDRLRLWFWSIGW